MRQKRRHDEISIERCLRMTDHSFENRYVKNENALDCKILNPSSQAKSRPPSKTCAYYGNALAIYTVAKTSTENLAMSMVDVEEFLSSSGLPVIDVRSPGEFHRGHIHGAFSVPLFDDGERAEIGLLYKVNGRTKATQRGIEFVSSKIEPLFREIERAVSTSRFIVHCWRGGMRSRGVAWLCAECGLDPILLQGGYKAYRRHAQSFFEQPRKIILLAGPTGVGKTLLLQSLRNFGEQVIDLEALACHRGSVFGAIPDQRQPTVEQFENDLFVQWSDLDPGKPVWIEGESRTIGDVVIPQAVWQQMSQAPMVYVDAEREARIGFLIDQYGDLPPSELASAAQRLRKRLGGARLKAALAAIDQSDWRALCRILLEYYDKPFEKALQKRPQESVQRLLLSSPGESAAINKLVAFGQDFIGKIERSSNEHAISVDRHGK